MEIHGTGRSGIARQIFTSRLSTLWLVAVSIILALLNSTTTHAADTTKPTAPTGLAATVVSATQINLSWTASTDNIGVTGYRVERCAGSGCTGYAQIASTTNTTFNDSGLVSGTTYRYRARANDAAGNLSSYSSAVTAMTTDVVSPTAPSNLAAVAASGTKITLSWTAASDNVKVTGYRIESCSGIGCSSFAQIATTTTAVTYGNTGLTSTTSHSYRIRAVDAAGNLSDYSTTATTTTFDTINPVKPMGLSAAAVSNVEIDLAWTATSDNVAVTAYRIERCSGSGCSTFVEIATTPGVTYKDTTLAASTTYRYRIRASDAAGNFSAYSSIVTTTTKAGDTQSPSAPANIVATAVSATQINLSWTASTDNVGVTGYKVERCQGASCTTFAQIATPTTTSYSDTGLAASTSYSYRVRATDAANNLSNYSSTATDITQTPADTTPPSAPTSLTATATSTTQINLNWTASTDNISVTNYMIERCQGSWCNTFNQIATTTSTSYSDTSLAAETNYAYRVRATDAANNLGGYSNIANSATPYAGPITYTYTYDNLGRVIQASGSDGSVINYTYDANGNVTTFKRQ